MTADELENQRARWALADKIALELLSPTNERSYQPLVELHVKVTGNRWAKNVAKRHPRATEQRLFKP